MKKVPLFIYFASLSIFGFAQQNFWKFETERSAVKHNTPQTIVPKIYKTTSLSFDQYRAFLKSAPAESSSNTYYNGLEISLPYPDNSFKRFKIVETKMMEEPLAAQFQQIKTYTGRGIDDSSASVWIDCTTQGFHAFVLTPKGSLFIDPYQKGNNNLYITYFSKDYVNRAKEIFKCLVKGSLLQSARSASLHSSLAGTCNGDSLRTYRAAISCTGEYAKAVCPSGNITLANTMSAIITTMNRVNGVYQTDVDVRMILIGRNAEIVYLDSASDPYSGNNDPGTLISESQFNITSVIGSSSFDIGHTFSTGAGGLATAGGVVCNNGNKAEGITGLSDPKEDKYDIDFVAHEIGNQFGAGHTFESETDNCGGGGRDKTTAYEPGSGTTIMAYAGICGLDNIQEHSEPYFHSASIDQIVAYTTTSTGNTCPVITATGNHAPVVIMPASGVKIPKGTPFTLTGNATDIDGNSLTYSWEEWDLTNLDYGSEWDSGANNTRAPLFKVRTPKTVSSRTFPDMAVILANYPDNPPDATNGLKGETLPRVARDIKFRLVVRDNNPNGGGVATGGNNGCSSAPSFKVVVTDDGPFSVTSPNTTVTWAGGSTQNITWNVANTNSPAGINLQNVDILMSIDGGNTYPITLLSNTPNDGSQSITVPNIATNSTIRFMVKASQNIFFDISNTNMNITFDSALYNSQLQFSARSKDTSILLSWSTLNEYNNKGFEVLRSTGNQDNFVKIGFVPGAGSSSTALNYTLTDASDLKKGVVYYYRLRQIDSNNVFVYSDIKSAKLDPTQIFSIKLYPVPFHNNADIYLNGINKKNFKLIVIDITGRIIMKKDVTNNEENRFISINLSKQASGVYFIRILQDDSITTLKAVKH